MSNSLKRIEFLSRQYGISMHRAKNLSSFLEFLSDNPIFDINSRIWVEYGLCRVYFELYSQNNLPAIRTLDKIYFCCDEGTIKLKYWACIDGKNFLFSIDEVGWQKCSGLKTRTRFFLLQETWEAFVPAF